MARTSKISRSSHVLVCIVQALFCARQSLVLVRLHIKTDESSSLRYKLLLSSAHAFFSDLNEQAGRKGRLFMLLSQCYSHFKPDDVEMHKRDALLQCMPDIFLCGKLNCRSNKVFIYTLLKNGSSKHNKSISLGTETRSQIHTLLLKNVLHYNFLSRTKFRGEVSTILLCIAPEFQKDSFITYLL